LQGMNLTGLFVPPTFDGTKLFIQTAPSFSGTYARIQANGEDLAVLAPVGKPVAITNLAAISGWQYIKLEADTAQLATSSVIVLALRTL
jgi:hypothetical protein